MSFFKSTLLAASAALISTAAFAADPVAETTPGGFDWDGFYAGVGVTGSSLTNGVTDTTAYLDIIAGFNVTHENFLFGVEGWLGGYSINNGASTGTGGGIEARAGYLASEDVLVYTSVGRYHYDAGAQYTTLGLGAEFVVSDNLTIDTEYKYWGWSNNGFTGHSIGLSGNWYFN